MALRWKRKLTDRASRPLKESETMKNPNDRIRKIIICLLALIFLFANMPLQVYADVHYDDTAPVLRSFRILNSRNVDARKGHKLDMELEVMEEGTGIVEISVCLERKINRNSAESISADFDCKELKKAPLFTGKKRIKLSFDNNCRVVKGNYKIVSISLTDANGNTSYYDEDAHVKMWRKSGKNCRIIRSDYRGYKKTKTPKLESFSIINANHVDASKGLKVRMKLAGNWKQIRQIGFGYRRKDDEEGIITIPFCAVKRNRIVEICYPIEDLDMGKYEATDIILSDKNQKEISYDLIVGKMKQHNRNFVVKKAYGTPKIKRLEIKKKKISTPGLLEVNLETGKEKITDLDLCFVNDKGQEKNLNWSSQKGLSKGKHQIEIPVNPFWGIGTWKLKGICVYSAKNKSVFYQLDDKDFPLQKITREKTEKITVSSQYKTAYYGSVGNPKTVVKKLRAMKEGKTAVLDCRYSKIAKKEFFLAIAGKDKTLVFEDENVQWVFNGKKIKKSRCKNINLTSTVKKVKGKDYGYPDEPYILYMRYANNGVLPGKAEMRVNYKYLCGKYGIRKDDKLKLSYYNNGETQLLQETPEVAEDAYVEYEVTHNSTYLLFRTVPRLMAPSKLRAKGRTRRVVLTWGRVGGACGYKIYRSVTSKGCYKQIASVKGNKRTCFEDRKAKAGKRYYYRVKSTSSSKKIKGSYSNKVSGRALW